MTCFGIGSLGAAYAGVMPSDQWLYGGLAVVALLAASVALALPSDHDTEEPPPSLDNSD